MSYTTEPLLTVFDKQNASTVKVDVVREMARELGFEV